MNRNYRHELESEKLIDVIDECRATKRTKSIVKDFYNGMTYDTIAAKYKIDASRACSCVKSYIESARKYKQNN